MHYSTKKQEAYLNKFYQNGLLKDWLAYFSVYVWEELQFSAKQRNEISKVDERELTNKLIRELARIINEEKIHLPIRLFHSKNEKTNGSDIEIIYAFEENKNVIFPCQAKRLYVDKSQKNISKAKYSAFWHKTNNVHEKFQIKALLDYAYSLCAYPLYLLYNYSEEESINSLYHEKELLGSTLISAQYIAEQYFNEHFEENLTFGHLHPPAKPLHSITEVKEQDMNSFWGNDKKELPVKFYTDAEILKQTGWVEMNPPADSPPQRFVKSVSINEFMNNSVVINPRIFAPRFRIFITKEPIYLRKRNFNL
ncbi:DUF6615 family protein [Aureispira sp. CCB-QB1]|uniref:DUF6615 family protein n=1 Tax=Aureispira sp. CCB-QB1 TaxID=1313421 RepID=UPI000695DD10|nr:DUF6615 family protein [Aureispira sp. CCB-QB1]